jgi:4-amino-4-deoxy-L-arabinose transferase-like glycosyltransferase
MTESSSAPRPLALAAILVAAALVRLVWIALVQVDPRETFHWDMTFYDLAALRWTDGALLRDFDGTPSAKWSPGYPLLLGTAYVLFGKSLWVGKLLNVALATLTVWLTARLGTRLFDARVGLAAAAILALLPGSVLYAPVLLSETPFTALLVALLLLTLVLDTPERRLRSWLGYGVLLGVTTLVRGSALLFLAVPASLWWLRTRSLRRVATRTAMVGLGMAAAIAPWTLRNWVTMGAPVLISTQQAGMALTFAHSEVADGGMSMGMARFRDDLLREYRDLPQPEREIAENRFETRRALTWMLTHPLEELALLPRRWLNLIEHDHTGLTWSTERGPDGRPRRPVLSARWDPRVSWLADIAFWALLGLALPGLRSCLGRDAPERWLLPLCLFYFMVLHGVFFAGDPRFHAPLVPVLAILGAAGALGASRGRGPPADRLNPSPDLS